MRNNQNSINSAKFTTTLMYISKKQKWKGRIFKQCEWLSSSDQPRHTSKRQFVCVKQLALGLAITLRAT